MNIPDFSGRSGVEFSSLFKRSFPAFLPPALDFHFFTAPGHGSCIANAAHLLTIYLLLPLFSLLAVHRFFGRPPPPIWCHPIVSPCAKEPPTRFLLSTYSLFTRMLYILAAHLGPPGSGFFFCFFVFRPFDATRTRHFHSRLIPFPPLRIACEFIAFLPSYL